MSLYEQVERKGVVERYFNRLSPGATVKTVGRTRTGKWYGWSHRAIGGFKTRRAAEKFARSVS